MHAPQGRLRSWLPFNPSVETDFNPGGISTRPPLYTETPDLTSSRLSDYSFVKEQFVLNQLVPNEPGGFYCKHLEQLSSLQVVVPVKGRRIISSRFRLSTAVEIFISVALIRVEKSISADDSRRRESSFWTTPPPFGAPLSYTLSSHQRFACSTYQGLQTQRAT